MLYKQRVLTTFEKDITILTTSIISLDKHAITPENMKRNLIKVREDLEQLQTLVNRESDGR